jgi:hypothetical protein
LVGKERKEVEGDDDVSARRRELEFDFDLPLSFCFSLFLSRAQFQSLEKDNAVLTLLLVSRC